MIVQPSFSPALQSPILVTSTPSNDVDQVWWISSLGLTKDDQDILMSERWLSDSIMYSAQKLLQRQVGGSIAGWQSTQCWKRTKKFDVLPYHSPFIQILNIENRHWVTVSNILTLGKHSNDKVYLFDSMRPSKVAPILKEQLCSFIKPGVDELDIMIVDVQQQNNSYDCGLFALAYATELAFGYDPATFLWDQPSMRKHLLLCFEAGEMKRFPISKTRTIGLRRVRRCSKVVPQCVCRMPRESRPADIRCGMCQKWFHSNCIDLNSQKNIFSTKWLCDKCDELLHN